jgi:hypothetical protein
MARLRISSNLRQNGRRFYLCQAYTHSSRPCPQEADWTRLVYDEPTYLCEDHHQALEKQQVRETAA